jgi:hypothetical protein
MRKGVIIDKEAKYMDMRLQIDSYTKIVLSIIAISLLVIAGNILFKAQNANAYDTVQDINIKSINGSNIYGYEIPVNLKQINGRTADEIPVDLQSIKGRDIWNEQIPVDIKAINSNPIFGSDLPVRAR